jgi:hypothetical protein
MCEQAGLKRCMFGQQDLRLGSLSHTLQAAVRYPSHASSFSILQIISFRASWYAIDHWKCTCEWCMHIWEPASAGNRADALNRFPTCRILVLHEMVHRLASIFAGGMPRLSSDSSMRSVRASNAQWASDIVQLVWLAHMPSCAVWHMFVARAANRSKSYRYTWAD